jgi:hypothetical protein
MSVFNSLSKAAVALILILMGFAYVNGLLTGGSEITKVFTGPVEADRLRLENKQKGIELEAQAKVAAAQAAAEVKLSQTKSEEDARLIRAETEAKIAQIQENLRMQIENNNRQLVDNAKWTDTWTKIVGYTGIGFSVGLVFILYRLAQLIGARQPPAAPAITAQVATPSDPWNDPAYREWCIAQARRQEFKDREQQVVHATGTLKGGTTRNS